MSMLAAICLTFSGSALLYQADEHRADLVWLQRSKPIRYAARLVAIILLVSALWFSARPQGWERGIPVWIGLVSAAVVAGLYLAARRPRWHLPMTCAALAVSIAVSMGALA